MFVSDQENWVTSNLESGQSFGADMLYRALVLVDDDTERLLVSALMGMGFWVESTSSADLIHRPAPKLDLVLVELSFSNLDGLRICRQLRSDAKTRHIAIIAISGVAEPALEIEAFRAGADDFMPKPVSIPVLRHRIDALLSRRRRISAPDLPEDLELDHDSSSVRSKGVDVPLAAVEFAILNLLLQHRTQVVTRAQFIDSLTRPVKPRTIDVNVVSLRAKLGKYGKNIETIRGVGYRFNI